MKWKTFFTVFEGLSFGEKIKICTSNRMVSSAINDKFDEGN